MLGVVFIAQLLAVPARAAGVSIVNFTYQPEQVEIDPGEEVTWTNFDESVHSVTADDRSFDSGNLATGQSYALRFDVPGTYRYHCEPHPFMHGTVAVRGTATSESTTSTTQPPETTSPPGSTAPPESTAPPGTTTPPATAAPSPSAPPSGPTTSGAVPPGETSPPSSPAPPPDEAAEPGATIEVAPPQATTPATFSAAAVPVAVTPRPLVTPRRRVRLPLSLVCVAIAAVSAVAAAHDYRNWAHRGSGTS